MAINFKLLRRVRNKILRVPEAYDQGTFGEKARTPCGTRACIAGHVLIEAGVVTPKELSTISGYGVVRSELINVPHKAAELLGLNNSQKNTLFGGDAYGWGDDYDKRWFSAKTKRERARVAADKINEIIRTGEV